MGFYIVSGKRGIGMSEGGDNLNLPQATHWPPVSGPGEGCVASDHLIHANVAYGEQE